MAIVPPIIGEDCHFDLIHRTCKTDLTDFCDGRLEWEGAEVSALSQAFLDVAVEGLVEFCPEFRYTTLYMRGNF